MKRILALALAGSMLASLAGCGGKDSGTTNSTPQAGGSSISAPEPAKTPDTVPESNGLNNETIKGYPGSRFHDGLALISFQDTASGQNYRGLIDTDGKLQMYAKDPGVERAEYDGEYVYLITSNTFFVLNKDFELLSSHPRRNGDKDPIAAYGGGYVMTWEEKTGFDTSGYLYHVFDAAGKEISSLTPTPPYEREDVIYMGEGAFAIGHMNIYLAKQDQWLPDIEMSHTLDDGVVSLRFQDGLLVYYCDPDEGRFSYIDDKGSIQTVSVPEEYIQYPSYFGATRGILMFQNFNTLDDKYVFCVYDTKSGQFKQYQGIYADRLEDTRSGYWPVCGEGYFAIALRGADGQVYTVLLNENLEELCEPVPGVPYAIQGDCLYTMKDGLTTYDLNGTELNQNGGINPEGRAVDVFSDSILLYNFKHKYYRPDGSEVEYDFSTGKLATLPQIP